MKTIEIEFTASAFLEQANIRVARETLTDGSEAYNLHIGDREFPCYSERHANDALLKIASALANNSNGPRFDYIKEKSE